jgi:predicted dehydrogenase
MKILMVGLGAIGQRHVRNLRKLMGSEVDLLAYRFQNGSKVLTDDMKIENDSGLEEKYNICSYNDLDQALAQKPEIVFVCNPSSLHVSTALKAARAGCHLFIEKPLSHNLDRVEELIELVESQNLIAVVGYQMRFNPCLQRLHSILQEKTIGRILSVRAEVGEYLPNWHTYEDYRHTYASRLDQGGGALLSQIHEMDYLYWLFGMPRRVFALGGHLSSLEIEDVDDITETLMEYKMDGGPAIVSLHQDFLQRPGQRTCQVIGDHGKVQVNLAALTVNVFDGDGKQVEATSYAGFQRNQMFLDELSQFFESIRGLGRGAREEDTRLVTVREGAQSLRMASAAKESLTTGKVVDLAR